MTQETNGASPAGAQFTVGGVLSKGFSILFRNIVSFGLLSLIFLLIPTILSLLVGPPEGFGGPQILITVVQVLFGYMLTAALVYGTIQDLRGPGVSISAAIAGGLQTLLPVIAVAVIVGLAVGIGLALLIVPGLIILTILWVAIPAAVVERSGVGGSLSRSAELTKGYRWQVFGIVAIVMLLQLVISALLGAGLQAAAGFVGLTLINWIVGALFTALNAVIIAVGYHDLRVAKEGANTGQIASVFD